jgi:PII-like signaling protein
METQLAWLQETKLEIKNANERLKNLQKQILSYAKENGVRGAVNFDYAGGHYEANLNIDRTRTKLPSKEEVVEQFRKMLPEGMQTVENAKKVYESLQTEAKMNDSVTIKAINPPKEVMEEKAQAFQKALNGGNDGSGIGS